MKKTLLLLMLTCSCAIATAQERSPLRQTEFISADSLEDEHELLERVRNMPNLEVGKGITFRPTSPTSAISLSSSMTSYSSPRKPGFANFGICLVEVAK